jgi:hypothetical protein
MITSDAAKVIDALCKRSPLTVATIVKKTGLDDISIRVAHDMFPHLILAKSKDVYYVTTEVKEAREKALAAAHQ